MAATVVDPALIASVFKEEGLVPVAGVAAFQDPVASYTDRSMAIQYAGEGGYLWLDAANAAAGGKAWLNPYADTANAFIGDLIEELYGCGFEQVCLSAVQFPPIASSSQSFGETGGRSRDAQLAADIAAWDARHQRQPGAGGPARPDGRPQSGGQPAGGRDPGPRSPGRDGGSDERAGGRLRRCAGQ